MSERNAPEFMAKMERRIMHIRQDLAKYEIELTRPQLELRAMQDLKLSARAALGRAVKLGRLVKPSECSRCGRRVEKPRDMHGHHADYSRPLDVEWLCRWCHFAEDRAGWAP